MSTKRYSPTIKTRNDLVGEITPKVFNDLGAPQNPHGPFMPAPWLPVLWQDTESKDYFVMSTGKVVALTTPLFEGWVVPAGLRVEWAAAAGGDTILTYTSTDYTAKVMDLTTGKAYATNGTTTYTKTVTLAALKERGLIASSDNIEAYISKPVGCVLGDVYVWAGGNGWNPAGLNFQNYQKQKGVQFTSFAQIELPLVPKVHASVSVPGSLTAATPAFGGATIHNATYTKTLERYNQVTNSNFVAWFIADYPIAKNTDRTPVEGSSTDFLVSEKKIDLAASTSLQAAIGFAVDRLTTAGDYFIDYEVGAVFLYSSGGTAIPSNATGETMTFYSYSAVPTSVERYACAVGDIHIGDWLMVDADSNLQVWDASADVDRIAKVVAARTEPANFMEYVRTGWEGSGFSAQQQMTGSASKGYSSQITYSGAANTIVKAVLNIR